MTKDDLIPWGYAKGFYTNTCIRCHEMFIGAKRAYRCEECADIERVKETTPYLETVRKKPVEVKAIRYNGNNSWDIINALRGSGIYEVNGVLQIPTLEGMMTAQPGDWIIRGVAGEVYPCKPDIFEQTYEVVQ